MAYHTARYFLIFLPILLVFFQVMPQKVRPYVLLLASYIFFWSFSKWLVILLMATSAFVYGMGILLENMKHRQKEKLEGLTKEEKKAEKLKNKKREREVLMVGIGTILFVLIFLKYTGFIVQNLNHLLSPINIPAIKGTFRFWVPIGISFYTLEAVGYLADIYWGKYPAERNFFRFALFLSFFPKTMEGPICNYNDFITPLWEGNALVLENLSKGFLRIVWGLFKKIVIADRLFVIVQEIFDKNPENYHGFMIVVAAVSYTLQLFMEFSGGMDIVVGSGLLFGAKLPENFERPFFAKDAAQFWRRWHISLGVWLKTYVFYPMSVSELAKKWNKFAKAKGSKYLSKVGISAICLFPVWMLNGLWHGPEWNYIFYGCYYFAILLFMVIVEPLTETMKSICHVTEHTLWWNVLQILKTWVIIFTGELFFRANGFRQGLMLFKAMFHDFSLRVLTDGTFSAFAINKGDYLAIIFGTLLVIVMGILKEYGILKEDTFWKMKMPVRWVIYYGLMILIIVFGAYGTGYQQVDLIYAGF